VTPADELATALRFAAAIQDAVAREPIDLRWGVALRSPDLQGVFDANLARVIDGGVRAEDVLSELDRVRGDLWFDKLFVDDEAEGERLRPALEQAGFESTRLAVMAWRGEPPDGSGAREATPDEVHPVRVAINTEELAPENADFAPHIARLQERIAEEVPTHVFVAPAEGEIGALCSLYVMGGVAQVEEVSTLQGHRGQGLAAAAVRAAVSAALDAAPELVFIEADDEDWMKDWYARLGFEPIGRTWRFTRVMQRP
jgi:GNAT superfamily N-acetyltransferase